MLYLPKHDFSRAGFCKECVWEAKAFAISQGGSRPGSVASGAKEKSDMAKEKLIAASWECTEKLLTNPSLGRKDYGKNDRNSGSRRGAPPFFSGGTGGAPGGHRPHFGGHRVKTVMLGCNFPMVFNKSNIFFCMHPTPL